MNVEYIRTMSGLIEEWIQPTMVAIDKAMTDDETGDKYIDTIVKDNLQTLHQVKTRHQDEVRDEDR